MQGKKTGRTRKLCILVNFCEHVNTEVSYSIKGPEENLFVSPEDNEGKRKMSF